MSTVDIVSDVSQGQLLKWTNYVKGYRNRWFLLQNGFLSYYKFDHVDFPMHVCQYIQYKFDVTTGP